MSEAHHSSSAVAVEMHHGTASRHSSETHGLQDAVSSILVGMAAGASVGLLAAVLMRGGGKLIDFLPIVLAAGAYSGAVIGLISAVLPPIVAGWAFRGAVGGALLGALAGSLKGDAQLAMVAGAALAHAGLVWGVIIGFWKEKLAPAHEHGHH